MANGGEADPYRVIEPFNSMCVKFFLDEDARVREGESVENWFKRNNYAFLADLLGFEKEDIENAVNEGGVSAVPWPSEGRKTDFLSSDDEETKKELSQLADQAVDLCYGKTESDPVGGSFATVGAEMGGQQLALAGLIHAREEDRVWEITEFEGMVSTQGPLYIVKGGFSEEMFGKLGLLPEEPKSAADQT